MSSAWKKAHPAATHEQEKRYRMRLRAAVVEAYGGKCAECGDSFADHLELDHENGHGNEQRAEIFGYGHASPGGWNFYRWLKVHGYPQDAGLRLLCKDCHDKKHGRGPNKEEKPRTALRPRPMYAIAGSEEDELY
jgi:5-methylcytosine-specific restriction endonuclease McrA